MAYKQPYLWQEYDWTNGQISKNYSISMKTQLTTKSISMLLRNFPLSRIIDYSTWSQRLYQKNPSMPCDWNWWKTILAQTFIEELGPYCSGRIIARQPPWKTQERGKEASARSQNQPFLLKWKRKGLHLLVICYMLLISILTKAAASLWKLYRARSHPVDQNFMVAILTKPFSLTMP